MSNIAFDEFSKIDMRVGKVQNAENVDKSDKLIKMDVDFGDLGKRTIFAGIRKWYNPDNLIGNLYIFVFNLEPKEIMGDFSQGMIIAAEEEDEEKCTLLIPDKRVEPGTKVF